MNTAKDVPINQDLVLIGGGHAHAIALKMLAMRHLAGVRITLISSFVQTPYSGMLPGLIAGNYDYDEVHIDLGRLCRALGVRFIEDTVTGLDLDNKTVFCQQHPPFQYDVLSIDTGSAPDRSSVPGASALTTAVKPVDQFLSYWSQLQQRLLRDESGKDIHIGAVGAGASGVEVVLAMQYRLQQYFEAKKKTTSHLHFHLVAATEEVLPSHNRKVRHTYSKVLRDRNVSVHNGFRVTRVDNGVLFDDSRTGEPRQLALDEIIWAISAAAPAWPRQSGLAVTKQGFIEVNACLQSTSHANVFAAGDIADVVGYPRPKAGVFAVRQGPPLAKNLERALKNQSLSRFSPQRQFLSLVSTGNRYAVASRGRWTLSGAWVWRWKDSIDRKFMRGFSELNGPMALPDKVGSALSQQPSAEIVSMRCGGCGAKVGQPILNRVIRQLSTKFMDRVDIGVGQPDDAAVFSVPAGKLLVQSVDAFRRFIDDDYVFGQIAANHALGDIFAMGATPHSAQALVTLPFASEEKVEQQLLHLMMGAAKVFDECEMPIIGGHTAEGAELSLGFAINGLASAEQLLKKGGLKVGDKLILTKPLGTGTLFAADMRGLAHGLWVKKAIVSMQQSNLQASKILQQFGATACTDVTGFGLAGHLMEMLQASRTNALLSLASLPVLDGAVDCIQSGILSTLHAQNRQIEAKLATWLSFNERGCEHSPALLEVIFDPQTAGGLLAGIAADQAESCLKRLHDAGYKKAVIVAEVTARDEQ